MIRRLARGAFALGVIAAMLGLLAPAAAASGTWIQINGGAGPFGTWSLSSGTASYSPSSSSASGVAQYRYSALALSARVSIVSASEAPNSQIDLMNTSDAAVVLEWSTASQIILGATTGVGQAWACSSGCSSTYAVSTPVATGQVWQVSWDPATLTVIGTQYSSSGTQLQQWTFAVPSADSPGSSVYPSVGASAQLSSSFGVSSIIAGPPSAPTGLTATAGDGSVALSWTASSGASSYTVLESTSSGGTYSSVASGITGTTYTVTGLTNGTTYYFEVEAVNGSGTSSPSGSASATPSAATTPPATPSGLTATGGSGQVSLSWNTVTGATYYGVLRGSGPSGPFALIAKPAGTTYTDTGLQSTTTYYYEVEAVNSAGASSPSSYVSATTLAVTLVAQPFSIPSLADAGLWGAIGALFSDLWPPIVLALALMLFAGLGGGFISVVMRGADKVRGL